MRPAGRRFHNRQAGGRAFANAGNRRLLIAWLVFCACLGSAATGRAQSLSVRAAVEANSVFVGETFRFQIQVTGSDSPEEPDLSSLRDFNVQAQGGASNSRSSVTIINGRMTKNVELGYIFNFDLTPVRAGTLSIPSILVRAGGQAVQTQALTVVAQEPEEVEDFKLRISLSKPETYVGEPLILETVFYYSSDVQNPQLTIPLLQDGNFEVVDIETEEGSKVEQLGGKPFSTMRLRKAIIPRKPGEFTIAPATLSFQGAVGYRNVRGIFGSARRQAEFSRFVIPSNALTLSVRDLPAEGRPANFAGHVGEYQISASATPTEVNVGDPITLNISVSGPPFLDRVVLPPLQEQESLKDGFRIPAEMEEGAVHGNFKVFTQSIRAERDDLTEIPPIELPYFDTEEGVYKVAKTKPIPLTVHATRVLTANDAEGLAPVTGQTVAVEAWARGIAHNYENLDALVDQSFDPSMWLRSPVGLATIAAPPLGYAALWVTLLAMRRRRADPEGARARKALGELTSRLSKASESDEILEALRSYLGDKLRLTSSALTFNDIAAPLERKGVSAETVAGVREVFEQCEVSRYAGGGGSGDTGKLSERSLAIARQLEKVLR